MPTEQKFEAARQRGGDIDVLMAEFLRVQDQQHVRPSISLFLHSTNPTKPKERPEADGKSIASSPFAAISFATGKLPLQYFNAIYQLQLVRVVWCFAAIR